MALSPQIQKELRRAIKQFWFTREKQAKNQGAGTGAKDAGARTAITGGRQMDGFVHLVRGALAASGLPKAHVYCERGIEIPGWYRPEKQ
jgi:Restriction endonuclease XhoI